MSSRSADLPMTSSVSPKDSRSSTPTTTAAGWAVLGDHDAAVLAFQEVDGRRELALPSSRGICSLTDMAIGIASSPDSC